MSRKLACALAVILSLIVMVTSAGGAFAQEDSGVASQVPALAVAAPRTAAIGEAVTIAVTELNTGNPVSGVEVWAWRWPLVRPLATDAQSIVPSGWHYQFLGTTGDDGKLTPAPTFEDAGRFLIIATHSGYAPGLHIIVVKPKALAVEAPEKAAVGEPVTIRVVDRSDDEPVAEARVYALRQPTGRGALGKGLLRRLRDFGNNLLQRRGALKNNQLLPSGPPPSAKDETGASLENLAVNRGQDLGQTDENGELIHAFGERGRYLVVATKDGYIPGITHISIGNGRILPLPNHGMENDSRPGLRLGPRWPLPWRNR